MAVPVLTLSAQVGCPHGGRAAAIAPSQRVRVLGVPALLGDGELIVVGCTGEADADGPCSAVHWLVGSSRVRSEGRPLVPSGTPAIIDPGGTAPHVLASQQRVRAG